MVYSHTRKVGSLGRYGPRIGRKVRDEIRKIEDERKVPGLCPQCKKSNVKRLASGVWSCRACNAKFAGGAYTVESKRTVVEAEEGRVKE